MKSKAIKPHLDSNWAKGFSRYVLLSHIIDFNSWSEMEDELKKLDSDSYQKNISRLFNEFKLHNVILSVEYHITDLLNNFLVKEDKIKNWDKLKGRFVEKIERSMNTKNRDEAEEILKNETGGKKERMLTPKMMLDFARFGLGELINYVNEFTSSFPEKRELINSLTEFNESRKVVVHRSLSSREDVEEKIENGILKGKESIDLINKIIDFARADL